MEKLSQSVQTKAQNSIKLSYRSDIDGLRAVAVIAIVTFHAFPSLIPGGFVGVDIFFVISGFLITSLILQSQQNKIFSLSEFYAGRIRRIFPSLILVLSASFVFGWFALLSDEYKMLGKHIAASAVFIPNFIFWSESGYFDYAAATKPLLHLWSLGRPLSILPNDTHTCSLSRVDFEKRTSAFKTMVDKILTQRPEVKVIDLAKALCDEKRCYGSKDGVLFYIDDDHLSHRGSAYVVNKLRDEF